MSHFLKLLSASFFLLSLIGTQNRVYSSESPRAFLTPHQAQYSIQLVKGKNRTIQDVTGKLTIRIVDTGDGWTFEQECSVKVITQTGNHDEFHTTVASWESKDGKSYTFNVNSRCNDEEIEHIRGHATADNEKWGLATYQQPETSLVRLPPKTLFPLQYLSKILNEISNNNTVFPNQIVFDGISDIKEAVDINLTITPKKPDITVNNQSLLETDKAWSLQMAVFSRDSKNIEPDYEVTQTILKSGIILSMDMCMAYGEETFKAKVLLTDLKFFS